MERYRQLLLAGGADGGEPAAQQRKGGKDWGAYADEEDDEDEQEAGTGPEVRHQLITTRVEAMEGAGGFLTMCMTETCCGKLHGERRFQEQIQAHAWMCASRHLCFGYCRWAAPLHMRSRRRTAAAGAGAGRAGMTWTWRSRSRRGWRRWGSGLAAKRAPKQAETVWEQYMRRRRCPIYSQYLCQAAACNLDVAHANQGKCAGLQAYNACMQTAMAIPEQDARVKELFVIVNKEGNP